MATVARMLVIAAVATALLAGGCASRTAAPTTAGDGGTPVTFLTADGVLLEGRRFGDGPRFVVLAHMKPATMTSWYPFARTLAAAGYSALPFDFRGYGGSEGTGFRVDVDTMAAIDEAYRLGATEVFVLGASMGGTGAIAAGAARDVAGVATLSAPARFSGVDAIAAAPLLAAPLLLVASEGDDGYVAAAREIAAVTRVPSRVETFAGSRHGTDIFREHGAELEALLLGFLGTGR